MDYMTVTVKKTCVAAWKCPNCGSITVAETCWEKNKEIDLPENPKQNKSFSEIEKEIADSILERFGHPVLLDYGPGIRHPEKMSGQVEIRHLGSNRCAKCKCRPAWNTVHVSFPRLLMMLTALMTYLLLGWLCLICRIDITPTLGLIGMIISLIVSAGVSLIAWLAIIKVKSGSVCSVTEPVHLPLVAFQHSILIDEADPRSIALSQYLQQHPDIDFSVKTKRRMYVETSV